MNAQDRIWTLWMLFAALLLSVGSLSLLIAALSLFPSPIGLAVVWVFFLAVAVVAHGLAWFVLLLTQLPMAGSRPSLEPPVRWGIAVAYLASLIGFGAGLAFLPLSLPETSKYGLFVAYIVPYVPSVYGWVVVSHAALFGIASRTLSAGYRRLIVVAGSLWLIIIASFALTLQVSQTTLPPTALLWSLPGIAGIGYGFIAVGWWWEYKAAMNSAVGSRTAETPNAGVLQQPPSSDEE